MTTHLGLGSLLLVAAQARSRRGAEVIPKMRPPERILTNTDDAVVGGAPAPDRCLAYGRLGPANVFIKPDPAHATLLVVHAAGGFLDVGGRVYASLHATAPPPGAVAVHLLEFLDPFLAWAATPVGNMLDADKAALAAAARQAVDTGKVGSVLISRAAVNAAVATGEDLFLAVCVNWGRNVPGAMDSRDPKEAAGRNDATYTVVFRFAFVPAGGATPAGFEGVGELPVVDPSASPWMLGTLRSTAAAPAAITPDLTQPQDRPYSWSNAAARGPTTTPGALGVQFAPGLARTVHPLPAAPGSAPETAVGVVPVPAAVSVPASELEAALAGTRPTGAGVVTVTHVTLVSGPGVDGRRVDVALSAADFEVPTETRGGARVVIQTRFTRGKASTVTPPASQAGARLYHTALAQERDSAWAVPRLVWNMLHTVKGTTLVGVHPFSVGIRSTAIVASVDPDTVASSPVLSVATEVGENALGRPNVVTDPAALAAWRAAWAARKPAKVVVVPSMPALHTAATGKTIPDNTAMYRAPADGAWLWSVFEAGRVLYLARADVVGVDGAVLCGPVPVGLSIAMPADEHAAAADAALVGAIPPVVQVMGRNGTQDPPVATSDSGSRMTDKDGLRSPHSTTPRRPRRVAAPAPAPAPAAAPALPLLPDLYDDDAFGAFVERVEPPGLDPFRAPAYAGAGAAAAPGSVPVFVPSPPPTRALAVAATPIPRAPVPPLPPTRALAAAEDGDGLLDYFEVDDQGNIVGIDANDDFFSACT